MSKFQRNTIISTLIALTVYLFLGYSETSKFPAFSDQWMEMLLVIALANAIGFILIKLNSVYNRLIPWNRGVSLRFFIEVSSSLILYFVVATIFFIYLKILYFDSNNLIPDEAVDGLIKFGILSLVISYSYSLINFSIYSYNQYSVGQIEALASERIQLDLRFEALKSQLNPHFLFNALNTISSLIFINKKQAEKYIRLLAGTYNYILETNGDKVVSIAKEIEMTKAYFYMHKIRYEDFVELKINKDLENEQGKLPPFTLQILVENAIKHTVICEKDPLLIEIYGNKNNQIVVKNNIVENPAYQSTMENLINKQKDSESYKIGLSNIRERYSYLADKEIDVSAGKYFKVKVPII